jgi:putative pyruvate formate lyase activating enzyme
VRNPAKENALRMLQQMDEPAFLEPLEELRACRICPRNCNADRFSNKLGYCQAGAGFSISSICAHRGEEPAISGDRGICNIFFTNCNLQCVYCQNHQISCNSSDHSASRMTLRDVLYQVLGILAGGINVVGFVSPSHFVPQVKVIISALRSLGLDPVFVYNTNGYDRVEVIRGLEKYIDVYLPDYKYSSPALAVKLSDAEDYPEIALAAIREMFLQKGSRLILDRRGYARRGLIIRHLVLPGHIENSVNVLRNISSGLSNKIAISLMSQYFPANRAGEFVNLDRGLTPGEYQAVVEELEQLGFENGWVQQLASNRNYRPDFELEHPFEG